MFYEILFRFLILMDRIWKRREPRTHFTSVCSVGESSVTDEVNDILEEMSPNNLQVNLLFKLALNFVIKLR